LFFVLAHLSTLSAALSSRRPKVPISVKVVKTPTEITQLADLRYDEWIRDWEDDIEGGIVQNLSNSNSLSAKVPSRYAFRMATAEMFEERSGGATAFLAKLEGIAGAVGAAELSKVEFEGTLQSAPDEKFEDSKTRLYVTDVVTCSQHRRKGIASALMDALESRAFEIHGSNTLLFLHVKPENTALHFYTSDNRGYFVPREEHLTGINWDRLEENAGTDGKQILLCKELTKKPVVVVGTGFGGIKKSKPPAKKFKKSKKR